MRRKFCEDCGSEIRERRGDPRWCIECRPRNSHHKYSSAERRAEAVRRADAEGRPVVCSVEECDEPVHNHMRVLCIAHYRRWQRYGDPLGKPSPRTPGPSRRDKWLRRKGLSPATYDALLAAQGGGCAICGRTPEGDRLLVVDHDHQHCRYGCLDCIRGLLCNNHNRALGAFSDDPQLLRRAADYLEGFGDE